MGMSNEQKILNLMLKRRAKGHVILTPSEIQRGANLSADDTHAALERMHDLSLIDYREGAVHRAMVGRPARYYYPKMILEMRAGADVGNGQPRRCANPTTEPNPDVTLIREMVFTVDITDAWKSKPVMSGFDSIRANIEIEEALDLATQDALLDAVTKHVHLKTKWLFEGSEHGPKIDKTDLKDMVLGEPVFTRETSVEAITKKALHRLIWPWYPEYWAIGGVRLRRNDEGNLADLVYRRNRSLKRGEANILSPIRGINQDIFDLSGSAHRAAWCIATKVLDKPTVSHPEGFMKASLTYSKSDHSHFAPTLFAHETPSPVPVAERYTKMILQFMPDAGPDLDPAVEADAIDRCGGSILWALLDPHDTERTRPLWSSDPKRWALTLRTADQHGVRLTPFQHRCVRDTLEDD